MRKVCQTTAPAITPVIECARLGAMEIVPRYKFERMVADALDDLPDELTPVLDNVVIQVVDRNVDEPDLLGRYEGTPHTERWGDEPPDVISIYRHALCEMCDDIDDLKNEVYVTVMHEVAHAAGIDDDRLHDLGWG
ncbi:MAG TPA: metallopeptidase family protein [Ilumatobacter sp.]|nr:metallopeptidase family protein [Ilumatobacter sp.]